LPRKPRRTFPAGLARADDPGSDYNPCPDPEFAVLLKEYVDLVDQPHMKEIYEEEDPAG
jgi:hypothetical protein